jgi:hypothetical protein
MDVLSCSYDLRFSIFHSPVEVLDPGVFPQSCLFRLLDLRFRWFRFTCFSPLYLAD